VAFEPEVFKNLPVLFQNSISAGGIMAGLLKPGFAGGKNEKKRARATYVQVSGR